MVCGNPVLTFLHNTPPRPGLFLSAGPEFLERGEFFQQFLQEFSLGKIVSAYFPPDYNTAPILSSAIKLSTRFQKSVPFLWRPPNFEDVL